MSERLTDIERFKRQVADIPREQVVNGEIPNVLVPLLSELIARVEALESLMLPRVVIEQVPNQPGHPHTTRSRFLGTFEQADGKHDGRGEVRDDVLIDNPRATPDAEPDA